jgi:hypothetical protein
MDTLLLASVSACQLPVFGNGGEHTSFHLSGAAAVVLPVFISKLSFTLPGNIFYC